MERTAHYSPKEETAAEVDHVWGNLFRAVPPDAWEHLLSSHERARRLTTDVQQALDGYLPPSEPGETRAGRIVNLANALHTAATELEMLAKGLSAVDEQYQRMAISAEKDTPAGYR
jgi:hypothetical protein